MTGGAEAARILGVLSDPDRLKVVAALVLGQTDVSSVCEATGLDARTVEKAFARLSAAGLLGKDRHGGHSFLIEELAGPVREAADARAAAEALGHSPAASDVLRRFVRDGRLIAMPTTRAKRLVVLDWLAQEFEPGLRYTERDVNALLAQYHDDVATLRRQLVDEGFMERDHGEYWRAGGTYHLG